MAGENQFDQVVDSGGGTASEGYNKEYVFFKDIIPSYSDSDRSGGGGFSDLNRLTTLLHSWGFSDVDVSNITEWKISGKNQYTDQGPRLEWKGNLFVKRPGLDLLKCKNKDKTSFQTCTDIQEDNYILLNTHASGYAGATWKWIHISEFGFAIRQDKCYLSDGKSTMNNIVEFMTEKRETPKIEKNISENNKIFPENIVNYTWPISSYYVPNYLINNNNINGWGNLDRVVNTRNFDYRIYIDYGTSVVNSHRVRNFNLLDETPVVIYSDFDEDLTKDNSNHTIKYINNTVFINNVEVFKYFNPEYDILLCGYTDGVDIKNTRSKQITLTHSGRLNGGWSNFYPSTAPVIKYGQEPNYGLSCNINWRWYLISVEKDNTNYSFQELIKNSKTTNAFDDLIPYTRDSLNTTGGCYEEADYGTISTKTRYEIWEVAFKDCSYTMTKASIDLNKTFRFSGIHVDGIKKDYDLEIGDVSFNEYDFTTQQDASYDYRKAPAGYEGYSYITYYARRGFQGTVRNNLLYKIEVQSYNNSSNSVDYYYGQLSDRMLMKESLSTHEYFSMRGGGKGLYAIICLKNYKKLHLQDKSPIFRLSTNGKSLECEAHNLYDIDLPCTLKLGGTTLSHTIPANDVYDFVFEYGWSNEESLNNAVASYENPWFGNTVEVPFSEMYRIYDRSLSLYRYLEGSDHIILVHNNTSQPTTVSVYNKNMSSPLESLTSTKNQDFIRLENYESAPSDYLDNLTVKYYHPDKCQWFTVSYKDIPRKTGIISTKTETYKWYQGGVSSGQTYKTDWLPTNIYLSDWDRFSHATSDVSGWSPSVSIETRLNSKNQYEWRCIFYWNGGGANYSGGTVTLTCHQLTFNN